MRRLALALATGVVAGLAVSAPAYAFAHDRVTNPYLHAALDVLTLVLVSAPLWTAYLWGGGRRAPLLTLVALVQLPAAAIGFVPIVDPVLHVTAALVALAVTAASVRYVRSVTKDAPLPTVVVPRPR